MRRIKFELEMPTELPSSLDGLFLGPLHLFDYLVIGCIIFFMVGLWIVVPPISYDDFYHMAVAQQIYRLGFIPTWDFWEFAPIGRPHLYPPLLHMIMALLMKANGGDILFAAKMIKVVTYPLLVFCLWWSSRKFAGYKSAFYTVLVYIGAVTTLADSYQIMPATLVLLISFILFWTFTQKKLVPSIILMSLALWTHISLPLLTLVTLGVFSIIRKNEGYLKFFAKVSAVSLLVYSPWLIHILANFDWLSTVPTPLEFYIPLLAWIIGLAGAAYSIKYLYYDGQIFGIYALILSIMFFSYGHRFWIYIMIPLSFYTGLTIAKFIGSRLGKWRKVHALLIVTLAFTAITFSPTVGRSQGVLFYSLYTPPLLGPSASTYLILSPPTHRGLIPISFDPTGNIDPIGNTFYYYLASIWIQLHTLPYQPICVLGGRAGVDSIAITAFSGRPTTNGMWLEVMQPFLQPIVQYYFYNNATVYIIGPPFTSPPGSVPTNLVAQFGPIKIFERI
ncbi:MAG: ArnT family glycosyltransferase [Candidatus Jordarchaeum sp.]|uniref:ArnT family glycosyltransferase n=1 Tax=Candidatus Jordarchaeum sp. TaxID=2823881 RepID=UPI00404A66B5